VKTELGMSKAELARKLGVSRTYVTLLTQGRRRPSQQLVIKLTELMLMHDMPLGLSDVQVGKRGLEPRRLSAHDPKSCPSASSGTPPDTKFPKLS
jgi:transcriptional regulator with XRE-family HTH domain